jgi:hypothetical protein
VQAQRLQGEEQRSLLRLTGAPLRLARSALLPLLALTLAPGCREKATAGASCRVADQLVCGGADRALVCERSAAGGAGAGGAGAQTAWLEVPCRGPRGCARRNDVDECDDTVAAAGDACPRNPPLDYACTADGAQALVCKEGHFTAWRACRGPDACKVEGGRHVQCDTTLGEPGDPCAQQGTYACSVDKKAMLTCDGVALVAATSCRGAEGCRVERESRKVQCDDAVALEGDPCDQPKRIACAADKKSELSCESGKYARKRECKRSDCRLEGSELYCD